MASKGITADEGELAELDLRPGVAETLHDLRHRGDLRLVAPLPGGVEGERGCEIVEPVGVERRDGANGLVAPIALRRGLWRAQGEAGLAETLSGELTVIGDRLARGALIEGPGGLGAAHRLRRPALPVGGAGDRQRSVGGLGCEREALGGQGRIVEEAQGDPAGVEIGVDLGFGRLRPHGLIADFERQPRLVEIEQRRGDHLALAPPAIGADHGGAIVRREAQQHRRLVDAAGAAGVLDPGEQEAGIVAERRRNGLDQRGGHRRARRLDAGLGQRENVGTGKRRGAQGGAAVTGVDQAVGAIFVIGLDERSAEVAQDDAFGQGVEIAVAPQGSDYLRRLVVAAHRSRRARRGDLSRARLRLAAGEKLGDLRRSLGMRGQFGFLPVANRAAAWPRRMGLEEGRKRCEGRMRVGAQRRPFQRRSPGRVACGLCERREARSVAPVIEDRGLGTERRRRRKLAWRGNHGRKGRRNRGEGALRRRRAWNVGISELRREAGVARGGLLGRGRCAGVGNSTDAASRTETDRARRRRLPEGCVKRGQGADVGGRGGGGERNNLVDPPIRGAQPRIDARRPNGASVDRRDLAGRPARLRGERNQASAGADGEKKARMENRHGSNPPRRGWTNFADQDLTFGPAACPFRPRRAGAMCPQADRGHESGGRGTNWARMMEKRAKFHGSMPALVTPFKDGKIDEPAYRALIDWQINSGSHGLVPVGTTGESPTLTHEEHRRAIDICIDEARGRVPVIAGAGSNNTAEAIELARHAERSGADAVLVVTPYYNKPTQEGLYQHFKAVNDAIGIPILIYNIPPRSVVDMSVDTMKRLSELANIVGVKDATGDVGRVSRQRHAMGPHFIQLSGEDMTALAAMAAGGHGCISVTANIAPAPCAELMEATFKGDWDHALKIQDRLTPLHAAIFAEPGVNGAKYALSLLGRARAETRLPLIPVSEATEALIRRAMVHAGLLNA